MSGTLVPFYRSYDLPWEGDEQASRRFRRILRAGLILLLLLAVIIPLLPVPRQQEQEAVPERLARVMIEQRKQQQPPPPPPKAQEKPKPAARPVPVPQPPVNRTEQARRKAEKSGLLQFQDQLADLRRSVDLDEGRTRNLTGVVGADTHAERSLIASRVGAASGGVVTADTSRGFGSGAGSLSGHQAAAVTSAIARSGLASQAGVHPGGSGRASRSIEEMELVIDRNKGAIYNLYARALRDNPALQGKLVLQITIAPSGEVTEVKVLSSELHDPELEQKVVTRVKMLRFDAEDVAPLTATHTFDFFPA